MRLLSSSWVDTNQQTNKPEHFYENISQSITQLGNLQQDMTRRNNHPINTTTTTPPSFAFTITSTDNPSNEDCVSLAVMAINEVAGYI